MHINPGMKAFLPHSLEVVLSKERNLVQLAFVQFPSVWRFYFTGQKITSAVIVCGSAVI
jgi:hypothetical protein